MEEMMIFWLVLLILCIIHNFSKRRKQLVFINIAIVYIID